MEFLNRAKMQILKHFQGSFPSFGRLGKACTFHVPEDRLSNLQNVDKRIEYISAELKRQEDSIKDLDKKQDDLRENLTNMQTQMQKLAQA